jgi:hypothetical protein
MYWNYSIDRIGIVVYAARSRNEPAAPLDWQAPGKVGIGAGAVLVQSLKYRKNT